MRARLGKCVIGRRAAESPLLACAATPDEVIEFAASLGERGTNKKTSFPGTRRPRLATSHTSRAYSSRGVGARARPDERGEAARTPHRSPDVPDAPVGGIDTDPASPGDSWQTRHVRENARTMPSVVRRPSRFLPHHVVQHTEQRHITALLDPVFASRMRTRAADSIQDGPAGT